MRGNRSCVIDQSLVVPVDTSSFLFSLNANHVTQHLSSLARDHNIHFCLDCGCSPSAKLFGIEGRYLRRSGNAGAAQHDPLKGNQQNPFHQSTENRVGVMRLCWRTSLASRGLSAEIGLITRLAQDVRRAMDRLQVGVRATPTEEASPETWASSVLSRALRTAERSILTN
jgi:hypothetical protein